MVLSFALPVIAGPVLIVSLRTLPSPLLDWLTQQPADRPALVPQSLDRGVALLMSVAMSIVILVVTIGLFLFRRWARSAYVVITALYFVALFSRGLRCFLRQPLLCSPSAISCKA
jgi:hypothetical protein